MKKLIFLAIVFAMLFSGCSKWNVEIVDPTKPVEGDAELSSESESKEEEPEETNVIIEHAGKILNYITEGEGLDWNTNVNKLDSLGINYEAKNVTLDDDWYWSADLILEKNGR